MICSGCGKTVNVYHVCDEEIDEAWCGECFKTQPCVTVPHSEGCETTVFGAKKHESPA